MADNEKFVGLYSVIRAYRASHGHGLAHMWVSVERHTGCRAGIGLFRLSDDCSILDTPENQVLFAFSHRLSIAFDRIDSWDCIRDEVLARYFRRFHGGHCTVAMWNAAVRRFCARAHLRGRGSILAREEIVGGYFRVTEKRLVDLSSPNLVRGKVFSLADIKARADRLQSARDASQNAAYWSRVREAEDWIEKAAKTPISPCQLYRHFAADGTLLYVGISLNFVNRLAGHRRDSAWFPLVANVTVEHFDSRKDAEAAERHAIRTEFPIFNRQHSVLRLAA